MKILDVIDTNVKSINGDVAILATDRGTIVVPQKLWELALDVEYDKFNDWEADEVVEFALKADKKGLVSIDKISGMSKIDFRYNFLKNYNDELDGEIKIKLDNNTEVVII